MSEFETYEDKQGDHRWRLTSGSDIVADSGEGYSSKNAVQDAVERVKKAVPDADILEIGTPHFELYKDKKDEFRWRLISTNGKIISDSGEGYSSKNGAKEAIKRIQKGAK